jgi:flagellar L-ring protein precursor FlgH
LFCVAPVGAESLYKPGNFQSLTSDLRPRKVGDVITVLVYESASASSAADTNAGRSGSVGLDLHAGGKDVSGAINASNEMDGRGRTQREGRILAQLTVVVKAVTDSGDLLIAGEQVVEVNNERQQISVEGTVRPQDISDANVVRSTRVANARIRYAGEGDLADKQRPAWWQRFLSLFGV